MAFKKLVGMFVEKEEDKEIDMSQYLDEIPKTELNTINLETVEGEPINIIEFYEKAGLGDLAKSILKVELMQRALPAALSNDAKKQTILSMIPISGLFLEGVLEDGNARIEALEVLVESESKTTDTKVKSLEDEISELLKRIETLQHEKDQAISLNTLNVQTIKIEIERIQAALNFLS